MKLWKEIVRLCGVVVGSLISGMLRLVVRGMIELSE